MLNDKANQEMNRLLLEGIQLQQAGSIDLAFENFNRILEIDSKHPDGLHYLGVCYYQKGMPIEAEKLIVQAIKVHPIAAMFQNLSVILGSIGRDAEAIEYLKQGVLQEPKSEQLLHSLGVLYMKSNQWKLAQNCFDEILINNKESLVALLNLANCYKNLGCLNEAKSTYLVVLKQEPQLAEAHSNLGSLCIEVGSLEEGLEHHLIASELRPDNDTIFYNLGNAYWAVGKIADALLAYKKALELNPKSVSTVLNYATALQISGQLEQSLELYKEAEGLDPSKSQIYINVGSLYNDLKRYEEATRYLEKGLTLNPNSFNGWTTLGEIHIAQGKYHDALYYLNKALSLEPTNGLVLIQLAYIAERQDSEEDAIKLYKRAMEKNAQSRVINIAADQRAEAALRLSALYASRGYLKEAYESYKFGCEKIEEKHKSFMRKNDEPQSRKIVLLRPAGRSGSLFLHSLIDGHPQISTLPSIIFKGFFGTFVWDGLCPSNTQKDWRETLVKRFFTAYEVFLDADSKLPIPGSPFGSANEVGKQSGLTELGPNKDISLKLDRGELELILLKRLHQVKEISTPRFFEILNDSYEELLGRGGNKEVIFHHIHNPKQMEIVPCLIGFADVQLLNIVREPLQSIESWMKIALDIQTESAEVVMTSYVNALTRLEDFLMVSYNLLNTIYPTAAVRLEDIKKNPNNTFKILMQWMGVEDHSSLRSSTFAGLDYEAPSSTPVRGFETTNLERKSGALFSENDQRVMSLITYPMAVQYGYRESDPIFLKNEIQWFQARVNMPLDFELKIIDKLNSLNYKGDVSSPRSLFKNISNRSINLLTRYGTYPGMAPWLKVN